MAQHSLAREALALGRAYHAAAFLLAPYGFAMWRLIARGALPAVDRAGARRTPNRRLIASRACLRRCSRSFAKRPHGRSAGAQQRASRRRRARAARRLLRRACASCRARARRPSAKSTPCCATARPRCARGRAAPPCARPSDAATAPGPPRAAHRSRSPRGPPPSGRAHRAELRDAPLIVSADRAGRVPPPTTSTTRWHGKMVSDTIYSACRSGDEAVRGRDLTRNPG